ncbi:MAG: hypothetical protein AB9869_05465 [Verrucomicrobiia bacterium]
MRIYFSGSGGLKQTPEALIPKREPHIMLTFYNLESKENRDRLAAYRRQKRRNSPLNTKRQKLCYGSLFMDSGAYTLHEKHARNVTPRDFSWFNLSKGSEFRSYCDRYANWIREMRRAGEHEMLCTNVDVIYDPQKTWEVQKYFEQEHGVRPVPVIHPLTRMEYVERYLAAGYDLLGMGGAVQGVGMADFIEWADKVFTILCPESNQFQPLVKVHGFAVTSWKLICRYPFWSVDSVSWAKMAAYGSICVPRWSERNQDFDFTRQPVQIFASSRSPAQYRQPSSGPLHMDHLNKYHFTREKILNWLSKFDLNEADVARDYMARSKANLHYFKSLEESRPAWPHPWRKNGGIGQKHGR